MAILLQRLTSILRRYVPRGIRQLPALQRMKNSLNHKFLGHDGVYNEGYYQSTVELPALESAPFISAAIIKTFQPKSVIDVGCGTGVLMESLRQAGIRVKGLEYSEAGLAFCRRRQLDVMKFDLEKDSASEQESYDVVVSMEVAEHLPATVADRYVDLLCRLSSKVVFTAASPGQGGQDHVNEQLPDYWVAKFKSRGFEFQQQLTEVWRTEWRNSGKVVEWYHQNLMLFKARESSE